METYIVIKISLFISTLQKYVSNLWNAIRTNDINYVDIVNCGEKNYLIYLKKLSWLDELIVIIKDKDESPTFYNMKRFDAHKIRFNNLIELPIPHNLMNYSITIRYSLKLLGIFKKTYKTKERVKTESIGNSNIDVLKYKIIEK